MPTTTEATFMEWLKILYNETAVEWQPSELEPTSSGTSQLETCMSMPHKFTEGCDCLYCRTVTEAIPVQKDNFDMAAGGVKWDADKPRWDLFQWGAAEQIVRVAMYGATKYDDWNWAKGMRWGRVFASCLRHLCAWVRGEDNDPETGLSHLAHAAWNILSLLEFKLNSAGTDDRHRW